MQRKVLNTQTLIEFICYIIFACLILKLVTSNDYLTYVTPRMKPYLLFTAAIMVLWALFSLCRLFQPNHRVRTSHCFVLVIPIVILLIPHKAISASDLTAGYVNMNDLSNITSNYNFTNSSTSSDFIPKEDYTDFNQDTNENEVEIIQDSYDNSYDNQTSNITNAYIGEEGIYEDTLDNEGNNEVNIYADQNSLSDLELGLTLSGFDEINKTITISDEEFYPWLLEIFTNMKRFEGYQIKIKGFIYKDDQGLKKNEFVTSRLMMSCCTSDLVPCGIVCEYDSIADLEQDTWVTVEGVIHIGTYLDNEEPQLTVTKISPAEKPEDEYIYPY